MTRKTWGPFTGNHLTAIAGFVILAIAMPGGLWAAASFTDVAIYNPDSAKPALFDDEGRLGVGDGKGAMTVDGTVTAKTEVRPADFFHYGQGIAINNCTKVGTPPAGKALIIKTIAVYNTTANGQDEKAWSFYIGATCSGLVLHIPVSERGLITVPVEPGFAIPAGRFLWAKPAGGTALWGGVRVIGYTMPASAVPASVAVR